jgi:hypothetical protein
MKNTLLFFLLALLSLGSYADISLDASQQPKIISQKLDSFFIADAVWPYENVNSPDVLKLKERWEGTMVFNYFGDSQFAWIYKGKTYLSSLVSFERKDAIKLENQDIVQIFMFNPDITVAAISFLKINKNKQIKGQPNLLQVKAMGVAKNVPDAMLITVDYYDSAKFLAGQNDDFPVFTSTLLVRFSDENGKLKIQQDDSCLGNPNNYKTIAAARKALTECTRVQK